MKTSEIHGKKVMYEDNAQEGVEYLRSKIDYKEALVFFDQAQLKGSAEFEDQNGKDYSLIYSNGVYVITRRTNSGSEGGGGSIIDVFGV